MRAKFFAFLFFSFVLISTSFAFTMASGNYVGSGKTRAITGLGFEPDLVIIKSDTSAGYPVWKNSSMPADSTAYLGQASSNFAGGIISLDSDGFTLGTSDNVNGNSGVQGYRYTWVAFGGSGGSDFYVGTYTGNATDDRNITGVGFQPNVVWIKDDADTNGVFYTSDMAADNTECFQAAAAAANRIQSLAADGFQIGTDTTVNAAGHTYYYVAFKNQATTFKVGTYAGAAAAQSISGVGFQPDFVLVKQSGATSYAALRDLNQYGNQSHLCTNAYDATNNITSLDSDGFTLGTLARVNAAGSTYYYLAFAGVSDVSLTGNFTFKSGSYTGNGSSQSITGLGFQPDLVLVKSDGGAAVGVFSTSTMPPDSTAYLAWNRANFSGGISSLDTDGFSVGNTGYVNTSGTTYRWYAFGGAPCSNFIVGSYTGNGDDDRTINNLGLNPDLLVIKSNTGNNLPVWRSSSISGDNSAYFTAAADAADRIQSLGTTNFQVGANAEVNTASVLYHYFAFKEAANYFDVGTYTGDGSSSQTVSLAAKPNWVWVKNAAANAPVHKGVNLSGTTSQYFTAIANAANKITALGSASFNVGSGAEVNTAATTYRYAAWLGTATKLGFLTQPSTTAAGSVMSPSVAVALQDQFGNTIDYDSSTSVTLSILTNPGSGTLSGTLTRTVSGGVATFEGLSINKTGTGYILQVASTGYTTASSETFDITPATGTSIALINQPSTREINTVFAPSLEVVVKDAYGNVQTSDNTTQVTMAIGTNPSQATLAGTKTKTVASGRAFFNDLSINFRGVGYTLTVSAPYITSITSEGFDITAEAVAPTIVSYSPTAEASGVSLASKLVFKFSEAMDSTAVQNAFSLIAVRDNSGAAITKTVGGTTSWTSTSTMEFTPSTNWDYSYMYSVTMSANARDSVGNGITNPVAYTFNTIATTSAVSTTVASDGLTQISLPVGALAVPFYVRINTSPEANPVRVNPAQISAASDKVVGEGDQFKFVLDNSLREFVLYDSAGNVLGSNFGTDATVVLPFTDADGNGYVDGVTPPVRVSELRLCRLDETNGVWVVYPDSTVNNSSKTVSAAVRSLSTFGVMARASTTVTDVYVFPSPFKEASGHTTMTFANLPSTCTIKVFTISGRLVNTIQETNGDRQATWNVTDSGGGPVQSGLYLYVVESSTDKKTGKFAVIK